MFTAIAVVFKVSMQILSLSALVSLMWHSVQHEPGTEFGLGKFGIRFLICTLMLTLVLFKDGLDHHHREDYEAQMEAASLAHFLTTNGCDGEDPLRDVDNGYQCGSQICVYLKEGSGFCGPAR